MLVARTQWYQYQSLTVLKVSVAVAGKERVSTGKELSQSHLEQRLLSRLQGGHYASRRYNANNVLFLNTYLLIDSFYVMLSSFFQYMFQSYILFSN